MLHNMACTALMGFCASFLLACLPACMPAAMTSSTTTTAFAAQHLLPQLRGSSSRVLCCVQQKCWLQTCAGGCRAPQALSVLAHVECEQTEFHA